MGDWSCMMLANCGIHYKYRLCGFPHSLPESLWVSSGRLSPSRNMRAAGGLATLNCPLGMTECVCT